MGFFDKVDMEKKDVKKSCINLIKSGDSHKIDLNKKSAGILVNLNWRTSIEKKGFWGKLTKTDIDLDLGCMYKLKNGEKGVIQALGNSFGSLVDSPYIALDGDDRSGLSAEGENLRINKPHLIDFIVVFAFIYDGAPCWSDANGIVTIKQEDNPDIVINLDNPDGEKTMCALATIENEDNSLIISKCEKYYTGHKEVDNYFGFGFKWVAGSKD